MTKQIFYPYYLSGLSSSKTLNILDYFHLVDLVKVRVPVVSLRSMITIIRRGRGTPAVGSKKSTSTTRVWLEHIGL